MDELAGGHVQMTGHTQAVLGSVLNLGITPAFQCQGIIADTPIAVAPVTPAPTAARAILRRHLRAIPAEDPSAEPETQRRWLSWSCARASSDNWHAGMTSI
jgi:hypothetical protein